MFDLWIDAAEEAYAEIALSPEFRKVYGGLVDAQMRVRSGMQKEVEQMSEKLGMPTRSEVDSAHRKIAELERQLRRMRDARAPRGVEDTGPWQTYDLLAAVPTATAVRQRRIVAYADRPGFDGVIQAASGLMHMTGDPEGPPGSVAFAIADSRRVCKDRQQR